VVICLQQGVNDLCNVAVMITGSSKYDILVTAII